MHIYIYIYIYILVLIALLPPMGHRAARICMASLIFNCVKAGSRILKQSSEQRERHFSELLKCLSEARLFTDASGEVSIGFTNITACT